MRFDRHGVLAVAFLVFVAQSAAKADAGGGGGTDTGGGGNGSEIRIDEIRADIRKWIQDGGHQGFSYPEGLAAERYAAQMLPLLEPKSVIIVAVTPQQEAQTTDDELKVVVDGQPKTCRGFISRKDRLPHILCGTESLAATSESDQYRLIHHEYAGLAGVERNDGAASDYALSVQLTDFLSKQTVLRLAIKRRPPGSAGRLSDVAYDQSGNILLLNLEDAEDYCANQRGRVPTARQLADYASTLGSKVRNTNYPSTDCNEPGVRAERDRMRRQGFDDILKRIGLGPSFVDFYYDKSSYAPPAGQPTQVGTEDLLVWSRSISPVSVNDDFPYFLNQKTGFLYYDLPRQSTLAVRCWIP